MTIRCCDSITSSDIKLSYKILRIVMTTTDKVVVVVVVVVFAVLVVDDEDNIFIV